MANEIVQGLLGNLLQPQQQGPSPADIMAAVTSSNPMAAAMALNTPSMAQVFGRGARGLLGAAGIGQGQMSAEEALAQSMAQVDLTTSNGLKQAAQNALTVGNRPLALQLTLQAQQLQAEEQKRIAEQNRLSGEQQRSRTGLLNLVQGSNLPAAQKSAVGAAVMAGNFDGKADKLLEFTFPNKEAGDRYRTVGNYVWDNTTGSWAAGAGPTDVVSPQAAAAASSLRDLPGIDFDQYDPASFASAERAYKQATDEQARADAVALLKPKLEAGEEWRVINGVEVPFPVSGAPRREAESAVAAYNQSKQNVLRKSDTVVGAIDRVLSSIAEGKTDTGVGAALGYVPGTTWWNQRMNVETIRANLGFGELQSMRAAAANGASGLGQLTERELSRLEALSGNLSTASTRDQFVSILNDIRQFYAGLKDQYTGMGDMTIEQYAGAPKPQQQRVTSPTGREYVVEEIK